MNDNHIASNGNKYTAISTVVAIIAIITAVIMPLYRMVDQIDNRIHEIGKAIKEVEQITNINKNNISILQQQLVEVETQFRWMTDLVNTTSMHSNRIDQLLWKRTYTEDLPAIEHGASGPGINSNVRQQQQQQQQQQLQ